MSSVMRRLREAGLSTRSGVRLGGSRSGLEGPIALFVLCFICARSIAAGDGAAPRSEASASRANVAEVTVSMVTVRPSEVHVTDNTNDVAAMLTVQIAHQTLTSEQNVELDIGSGRSEPLGVSASYEPAYQRVRLPAGPGGVLVRDVKVKNLKMGASDNATLDIFATLRDPSPGLRATVDNTVPWPHATLTIRR